MTYRKKLFFNDSNQRKNITDVTLLQNELFGYMKLKIKLES